MMYITFMRGLLLVLSLIITTTLFSQQPRLVLPIGHTDWVTSSKFSTDGKKLITSSNDKTAKIWDAVTGSLLLDLRGHSDEVLFAGFSFDNKKAITTCKDGTAKIWDAVTGSLLININAHSDAVLHAQFSADGKKIITASKDFLIKIWAVQSGELLLTLKGHNGYISSMQLSPDEKRLVTSSGDKTAKIWDVISGDLLVDLKGHKDVVRSACFHPDGKKIVTSSQDNKAKVWDAITGNLLLDLIGHSNSVFSAGFSPDGKKIVTASSDKTAKIWDAISGKLLVDLKGHSSYLTIALFTPDEKKIVTGSNDGIVRIWHAGTGDLISELKGQAFGLNSIEFSPDGRKFIAAYNDDVVKIWDITIGTMLYELKGHNSSIGTAQFSPNGEKIITVPGAKVWDAATGVLLTELKTNDSFVGFAEFNSNGDKIVTSSYDSTAKIWDVKSGKLLINLRGHKDAVTAAHFSSDDERVVTVSLDATTRIWNANSGIMIKDIKDRYPFKMSIALLSYDRKKILTISTLGYVKIWDAENGDSLGYIWGVDFAKFSPDGKEMITSGHSDNTVKIWNVTNGKLLFPGIEINHKPKNSVFSPDGKKIATSAFSGLFTWDYGNGKVLNNMVGHTDYIRDISYSLDGRYIISASDDNTAKLWNSESGKLLHNFQHAIGVRSAKFSPNGKKIITTSDDNTARVWDITSGELCYSFLGFDSEGYFVQVPSNFYQCSSNAAKLLHFVTKDLKVITFEQLDVKYNRPDKVLEAIGNTDTALIKSYRKAWEKRIKKLGIDTTAFRDGYSVPECDFINRDAIEYEQKTGILTLRIKGIDSVYKLERFNVWVNEAPVFGQRGIRIRKKNSNSLDTTITIKLSQGENRIETSITNVNGTESYRMPLIVNYTPAVKQKESLRFIGIGIDQFSDKQHNLKYSAKDIRDLSVKLEEKYGGDVTIDTLFNENVTISNVRALKQKLQQTTENDKVIVAYSGHGLLSSDFDYYLSTFSVNFNKPEENGLPYDELENLLDSIPARKKLMLIDACHSGEVDKDEMVRINSTSDSMGLTKGTIPVALKPNESHLGMKNSFELMQSLFVNVGKSTGATIISAAAGTQFALERGDLKNGVFTYSILEAMDKNPTMKISELKKTVGERVEQLTNGLQKPTSRNETIVSDWNLW